MLTTKDHILKAAFILFLKKGYRAVTMSDLERETGLTKGAFYHYFKSKEEIFIDVIDEFHFRQHMEGFSEVDETSSFAEFIDAQMKSLSSKVGNIRDFTNIEDPDPFFITLILEARKYYPGFADKIKVISDDQDLRWVNRIRKAQEDGEIQTDIDPLIIAKTMISIGMGMFKYIMMKETPEFALDIIKRQYVQMYNLIKS